MVLTLTLVDSDVWSYDILFEKSYQYSKSLSGHVCGSQTGSPCTSPWSPWRRTRPTSLDSYRNPSEHSPCSQTILILSLWSTIVIKKDLSWDVFLALLKHVCNLWILTAGLHGLGLKVPDKYNQFEQELEIRFGHLTISTKASLRCMNSVRAFAFPGCLKIEAFVGKSRIGANSMNIEFSCLITGIDASSIKMIVWKPTKR